MPAPFKDYPADYFQKETRPPQPVGAGRPARYDAEYERNGVAHLLLFYAPLENWRRVDVRADHVAATWAEGVRRLVEEDFPDAQRLTLVMDNLNTHGRVAVEDVSARPGPRLVEEIGIRAYAETRQLAQLGGMRI